MMSGYYMEYASYVIKERAIPDISDGLKPVQRRILHSLFEMDDGKLHKVANVVGNTMKYHPHGDSSIYGALVHMANREFVIERQGNFGNIYTGDPASAARYIECRLSNLAKEVLFNRELTDYVETYDSRNLEPIALPAKVPLLLMQGSEGIAVGMSTRTLPHNFVELLNAQINILRDEPYEIYPDFIQGGIMDVNEYDKGNGKVRLRARIDIDNEKTIVIRQIPASLDTERLIASIESAAQKGKLKIAQIYDYTAENVEIEIKLPRGVYAEQTIKALYAYTDCEISISCNCLVIQDNQPVELDINQVLEYNTTQLKELLKRELEIELGHLGDSFHGKTLVQIFIENRVYKRIEECESAEEILKEVRNGLEPYLHLLIPPAAAQQALAEGTTPEPRPIADDDIEKLLKIAIRRISRFDIERNRRELDEIMARTAEILKHLGQLTRFTINYIKRLLKTYGDLYPRRTQLEEIKQVDVKTIALKNLRVGLDRQNGFVGSKVKDENPIQCSEHDRLVILKRDGSYKVVPVMDKMYIGPVLEVYKADKDQIYSIVYRDQKTRKCYAKRFQIKSYIMDKDYRCCPKGAKVEKIFDRYGVVLHCEFRAAPRQRETSCELDFNDVEIRSASARGLKVTDKDVLKFIQIKRGSDNPDNVSTEE
ncbi:hypothetical protein BVX99_01080 [bacterium F16]|nr:hypothetical protein BVX99_01080 [bacterium F16]